MVLTMAKGGAIEDTIAELISLSLATYYVPKMVALLTLRSFTSQDLSTRRDDEEEKKERKILSSIQASVLSRPMMNGSIMTRHYRFLRKIAKKLKLKK